MIGMILAPDILVKMINGDKDKNTQKIMKMLTASAGKLPDAEIITTAVALHHAIWKANSTTKIQNLQKILLFTKVYPTPERDFTNEKKVMDDLVKFAGETVKK